MPKAKTVTAAATPSVAALDFHNKGDVLSYVRKTMKNEALRGAALHIAACASVFQAAVYGNCDALQTLYTGLTKNDQGSLKSWLMKHTTYGTTEAGHPQHWLTVIDGRFVVKNGLQEQRNASICANNGDTGIRSVDCFLVKGEKTASPFELVDLLAKAEGFAKQIRKQAETHNLIIPADLDRAITRMSAVAATDKAAALSAAIH